MSTIRAWIRAAILLLAAIGCGGSTTSDAGTDTVTEAAQETGQDASADTSADTRDAGVPDAPHE